MVQVQQHVCAVGKTARVLTADVMQTSARAALVARVRVRQDVLHHAAIRAAVKLLPSRVAAKKVNVIQNNYNALVLTLEGWSAKEIVGHKNIYIRRTDESALSTRGDGLRPKYSTDKSMVSNIAKNKMHGVHHLLEVCEGRFGFAPPK